MPIRALCVALLFVSSVAVAQEGKLGQKKQVDAANLAVNQGEVAFNILRFERAIRKVTGIGGQAKTMVVSDPKKSAGRTMILAQLARMFELSQPTFKFTPRMIQYQKEVITIPASHPQRASVEKLIAWGALNRVSPLITSKKDTVTLEEFGQALGTLAARIADLTHTPSSRWSPYLGG